MIDNQAKLQSKIEAFRSKKEVIKAQYSAAEAQVRISEAATGVGEEMADVGLAMQRALDKTENMRARASAVDELEKAGAFEDLTQLGGGEDDIDRQLKELSSGTQVDSELEKMKAELAAGGKNAGELGSGDGARGRGAVRMIVRIATEGQYRLADDVVARVNALDNEAVAAVEAGDEARFTELFGQIDRAHPRRGRAAARGRAARLRRDRPAAGHLLRGGAARVQRRRADPGLDADV